MCVWLTMAKLPPVIRPPARGLEEAKAVAVKARQEPRIYDMIEIFGASKSLFRGFQMGGYTPAPSFDVRSLAFCGACSSLTDLMGSMWVKQAEL